jgi:AcrR family transcriptional regulator
VSPSELIAPPRRSQAERRHEAEVALLDAASHLFAQYGIDNTSLADIGEEAGYSRGLVNHRFGTKAALVERLAARSQAAFLETLASKPTPKGEIAHLEGVIDSYLDAAAEGSATFFVMWGAAFPSKSAVRPIFVTDDARFREGIEAIVRSGQTKGRIAQVVDANAFAVAFVALLRGIGAQFIINPAAIDLATCKITATTFIKGALAEATRSTDEKSRERGTTHA